MSRACLPPHPIHRAMLGGDFDVLPSGRVRQPEPWPTRSPGTHTSNAGVYRARTYPPMTLTGRPRLSPTNCSSCHDLRNEILEQIAHIRRWGGRFVIPIPVASSPARFVAQEFRRRSTCVTQGSVYRYRKARTMQGSPQTNAPTPRDEVGMVASWAGIRGCGGHLAREPQRLALARVWVRR